MISGPAFADLPLTVEDLIASKGKSKLDLSAVYVNSDRQGLYTADPITVQTGASSFLTFPTLISENHGNTDLMIGTLGLRYGLTEKTEIFARTSYLHSNSRNIDVSGKSSYSENRFVDHWAGINHQFKNDNDTPAVLGFAEIALHEIHKHSSSSFKSGLVGLITYKAIDPVALSLITAYRFNQSRKDGTESYQPGNFLLLNPSIAFAANERVTLTTGIQWTNRQADRRTNQAHDIRRTSSDLLLGVGYGVSNMSTLNLTFKANVSGSNGADLRFNWTHTF